MLINLCNMRVYDEMAYLTSRLPHTRKTYIRGEADLSALERLPAIIRRNKKVSDFYNDDRNMPHNTSNN